jgi:hypothetical protein
MGDRGVRLKLKNASPTIHARPFDPGADNQVSPAQVPGGTKKAKPESN